MSETSPVHILYQKYLDGDKTGQEVNRLWGFIPSNLTECYNQLEKIRAIYKVSNPELYEFGRELKNNMRRLGILTSKVEDKIDRFDAGVVETGQQPNCLGGPSFILNKITLTWFLSRITYSPLYYVGDYDSVQPELLNIRVPSPSSRGMLIAYPLPPTYDGAPIRQLPNPDEDWLKNTLEKLESNYRGILKGVESYKQENILQNLSHAFTILKTAYYSTSNVADFSTKIIGIITNLEGDLGIPILNASSENLRKYFQIGYETLLSEPKRSQFVKSTNEAVDLIESYGYKPQIGRRTNDYVPFFLECKTPSCHSSRIELKYHTGQNSAASLEGKCGKCGEHYSYSVSVVKPDLSDLIEFITPRVDSRQIIVDSLIPVVAHIGGPGETSYYAEIIPSAHAIDVPFPVYVRYTRVFYNTPWNNVIANNLRTKGIETLMSDELFNALSIWIEGKKSKDKILVSKGHQQIRRVIDSIFSILTMKRGILFSEIEEVKKKLPNSVTRMTYLAEMKAKHSQVQEIDNYLSWAFGNYAPEKFGQEVSWAWLDFAIASGINDLTNSYIRLYNENTPNSSTFFINF